MSRGGGTRARGHWAWPWPCRQPGGVPGTEQLGVSLVISQPSVSGLRSTRPRCPHSFSPTPSHISLNHFSLIKALPTLTLFSSPTRVITATSWPYSAFGVFFGRKFNRSSYSTRTSRKVGAICREGRQRFLKLYVEWHRRWSGLVISVFVLMSISIILDFEHSIIFTGLFSEFHSKNL